VPFAPLAGWFVDGNIRHGFSSDVGPMKAPGKGPAVILTKPAEIPNYQVGSKAHVLHGLVDFSGFAFRVFIDVWS
jgi:hypothetical protein